MTDCVATVIHAERGSEGKYEFSLDGDIATMTPMKVVRMFMEHVDHDLFPKEQVDYECNAAFKSRDKNVVTAMGVFHFEKSEMPFLLMIAPNP